METGRTSPRLYRPQQVIGLALLLSLAISVGAGRLADAHYADGTGQGKYQNQIYWLEWDGFTFANGQSKTFNLPGNVTIVATVSNISGGPVTIARPDDRPSSAINLGYPHTGWTEIKSCDGCTNRFRLTLSANVGGITTPVNVVVADAEAAASPEYIKVTTDGDAWQLLEQFQAANLRATWSNNDKTLELHGNGATTYGTVLAVSARVTNFDFELKGGGISAAALGVFLPSDYGDAPASFNDAGHYIRQTFSGGLPGATQVYDPVSTAFTNFATVSDAPGTFLGAIKPDADPGSQNSGANATLALGDDTHNIADEDGIAAFQPLTSGTTSYAVLATAHNSAPQAATLWGWVDFNGNNQFSPAEAASILVPAGTSLASYSLRWSGLTVTPSAGTTVYARFRLTTGTLTDDPATPQDERAQGGVVDGEVEDYALTVQTLVPDTCALSAVAWTHNEPARPHGASSLSPLVPHGNASDEVVGAHLTSRVDGSLLKVTFASVPVNFTQAQQFNSYVEYQFTPAVDFYFAGLAYGNSNISGNHSFHATWVLHDVTGGTDLQTVTPSANPLTFNGAYQEYLLPTPSPAPLLTAGRTYRIRLYLYQPSQQTDLPYDDLSVRGYAVDWGDAPKDLSSLDAALSNAYPTLLADNGARHCMNTAIRLGAQIDNEPDGRPNLAADGDNIHHLNDEDGVVFNPALGITAANVILSGVSNNLVVTASAAGFVNIWIDYNQNGTFTDTGEQLFADHAVTAGANVLTFLTPNTAPHGATYMRFRYSTQRGVANTVTGTAPDGEVEDYRVEVALPSPTTCDADLVNGSFEAPPGANLYPAAQVPGWGFRATAPASGADFDQRHVIEIWAAAAVPAYEGNQFAEINGWVPGALYQDMLTTPGQTMSWQFAHRGRQGTDVMALRIGPPGATVQVTQVSDDNTAWKLDKGSYTVPAGQILTRFEFMALSSAGGNPSIGNFVDAVHFSLPCDFGDAPDTFATTRGANGARHLISSLLRLGVSADGESSGFPGANADGDDLNNDDDEDSLATPVQPLPALNIFDTSYTLPSLPVLNNTGSPAYLYGWVDFNRNGVFDAREGVSTTVPSNASAQSANLSWSTLSGLVAGQSNVRLRLSTQTGLSATGPGAAGEVEDYPLTILPGGAVVVAKNTVGGNGSFPFTSTLAGAGNFSLATSANGARRIFTDVAPGTHAISERVPAGWMLTGAACTTGTPGSFTVTAGGTVTCTFTNTRLGQINVLKRTVGGDGSFPFTSTIAAANNFTLTALGGRDGRSFTNLPPGAYAVGETTAAGWDLAGATCDNGNAPDAITLAAGANVSCTFTNTKRGSLTVVKNTVGGDGIFTYTSPTLSTIVLTTTNGTGSQSLANLPPGTYSLTETATAGWRLETALCSDGSPLHSIALAPGEDVTCTFRNARLDTIVILNVALGGDATFHYTSTVPLGGSFALTTAASSTYTYFVNVPANTYAISQTVTPPGWELAGATCSDGSDPATIILTPGETILCTFINEKDNTIIVEKRTIGGDGSFPFTSTVPGASNFDLVTINGIARTNITVTSPSIYSIVETGAPGWNATGAACDNGDSPGSITIGAGETITCVFTNTQSSSLVVGKIAVGNDAAFPFISTPPLPSFTLTTTNGLAVRAFADLLPGTHAITESTVAGWDLVGALCSTGENPSRVTLLPGQPAVCLFENVQRGALIIATQTTGGDGMFVFSSSTLAPASFSLTTAAGSAQRIFTDLVPGLYDVAEVVPSGWDLSHMTCDNGDTPSAIALLPGMTVTCTFSNLKLAQLAVLKESIGGDGTFDMASTTLSPTLFSLTTTGGTAQRLFPALQPGRYDVIETVPAGWDQTGAACSNGDAPDSVTLNAGSVVTCTLQNTKRGAVVVVTNAVGGDDLFYFASQTLRPSPFNLTTVSGTAQRPFTNLVQGLYDLTELVPAGWDLATPVCSDGSSAASIGVQPGETVTCVFTNTERGALTIVNLAAGGDSRFDFTSNAFPGGVLTLTTALGMAQVSTAPLIPGSYGVAQTVPVGWALVASSCSDGSDPANVTVGAGEAVVCTFVNTRLGSLTVVKQTVNSDGVFPFTSPELGSFAIATSGSVGQQLFTGILPGRYAITETATPGWQLTSATCSNGNSIDSIAIVANENVTCTFVGQRMPTALPVEDEPLNSERIFLPLVNR